MKAVYKTRNWQSYNQALINRGNINLWIDKSIEKTWFANTELNKIGRPSIYSDVFIQICLTIKAIYQIPLRFTQGFIMSFCKTTRLCIKCPNYSTISRRNKTLNVILQKFFIKKITDIAIDSTGLKVYGEGEWKVRQHGTSKRRIWRKFHIGINPISHEILTQEVTDKDVHDSELVENLINKVPKDIEIQRFFGDGAYDTTDTYNICKQRQIQPIIPPQINAKAQKRLMKSGKMNDNFDVAKIPRDQAIERIAVLTKEFQEKNKSEYLTESIEKARKQWKIEAGYHKRSLVEVTMFRIKKTFGDKLLSRSFENQKVEMAIKTNILNKFTSLGMPQTVKIG